MVEKRAGLTPLQIEVLEWIKAGQPPETFADTEDLTYRSHARWLEKYGLVSISGSGDTWRVKPHVPLHPSPHSLDGSGAEFDPVPNRISAARYDHLVTEMSPK